MLRGGVSGAGILKGISGREIYYFNDERLPRIKILMDYGLDYDYGDLFNHDRKRSHNTVPIFML